MADPTMFSPQILVPACSALIAVGALLTTIKVHGGRIAGNDKEIAELKKKEYCEVHHELCGMLRGDLKYLRSRIDQIVDRLGS